MKLLAIGLTSLTALLVVMALYSAYGTWRTEREFGPIGRFVEVDGNRLPNLGFGGHFIPGEAIVGGDARVAAISAASILAKTVRDQKMTELDRIYPCYGFARHKGYGTEVHRARLREFGPCREHRFTFAPVRAAS